MLLQQIDYEFAKVSSQLVTWPTRNQVNPYPGSSLVTTFEKSTRSHSLGYELTHAFKGESSTRNNKKDKYR